MAAAASSSSLLKFQPTPNFSSSSISQDMEAPAAVIPGVTADISNFFDAPPPTSDEIAFPRRSANYQPSIWSYDFVQSIKSDYTGETYAKRAEKLKEEVRRMFNEAGSSASSLLKLINTIQRLGVSYHFDDEIKATLADAILIHEEEEKGANLSHDEEDEELQDDDLFTRALRFRLLRQHGHHDQVSQDVFKRFKEEIMMKPLYTLTDKDVEGVLSLYEASFHAFEGEEILDETQEFIATHLKDYLQLISEKGNNSSTPKYNISNYKQLVSHALELPLHRRMPRIEARFFIDTYGAMMQEEDCRDVPCCCLLLEFAKLDFNMVQATYHDELKYLSRWWKELGFTEKVSYARDRLVENFFWSVGYRFEPKFGNFRIQMTKLNCLITTIDDVYDIYGYLDELKLFTDAVQRWDVNIIRELPENMRICFLALYNTTNEIAHDYLKKHGCDVLPYLHKSWVDLCKSYLVEAKWYYSGYTPTLDEYMENGWISITGSVLPTHTYFLLARDEFEPTEEALECLKNNSSDLVRWSFMIIRFLNDLATSSEELKRGDVPKSIQCYMHHSGVSESIAREHIKYLINDMWKKINKDDESSLSIFPRLFVDTIHNFLTITHFFYMYGDGHGVPNRETKDWVTSIVVEPIPFQGKTEI